MFLVINVSLYNEMDSQGQTLSGTIEVQATSDDDFIGFVPGYNSGDDTNASADYLLIDWKQTTQSTGGVAGWIDDTVYDFDLIFTSTNVVVSVNGNEELNISGNFANGSSGFYNLSQEVVRYAGIQQGVAPVPAPGVLLLMGPGFRNVLLYISN